MKRFRDWPPFMRIPMAYFCCFLILMTLVRCGHALLFPETLP